MWYKNTGKDSDVALASRVALTRNLEDFPFSARMSAEQAKQLVETVKDVYTEAGGWTFTDLETASPDVKKSFVERHVIPRSLAEKKGAAAVFEKDSVTVAVGGEDHVRIEAAVAGCDLAEAEKAAFEAEALLDEKTAIAFTEQFGYVTANPAELGTGMKASVTLHLPVSARMGRMTPTAFRLAREGVNLRSLEFGAADTGVYIASARASVGTGIDEDGLVKSLAAAAEALIAKERELREKLGESDREDVAEKARRSYGSLLYGKRRGAGEVFALYSALRLAAAMKLVDLPVEYVDEAAFGSMPHTLAASSADGASADEKRAAFVKEIMKKAPMFGA